MHGNRAMRGVKWWGNVFHDLGSFCGWSVFGWIYKVR